MTPEYAAELRAECLRERLIAGRRSPRPLPDRASPIVICVIRDEANRLPDFLRHYRSAGVERFVFVDNGSVDGTAELLTREPDVDLYFRPGRFDWVRKQRWINKVISLYGYRRWYLYADADEHLVFDGFGERSLRDVALLMDARGVTRVRGFLLDMYADAPLLDARYEPHARLADAFPCFDRSGYRQERYQHYFSVKGGPRMRVFGPTDQGFRPELTKYPLFTVCEHELMVNPHHLWPYEANFVSDRYLALLHYKFLPGLGARIARAVEERNYWDESAEYRCYQATLAQSPGLSLMASVSARLRNPSDLVHYGVIVPLGWPAGPSAANRVRVAFRRRRAELLAADTFKAPDLAQSA